MKEVFSFLKKEKWTIGSLLMTLVTIFVSGGVMLADATVAVTESSNSQPSNGAEGLATQVPGTPTTVSAVGDAAGNGNEGLIQPDIDDQIFQIATDETVLDGLARKAKRQVRVHSWEVDHYSIDDSKAIVDLSSAVNADTSNEQFTISVASSDRAYFKDCGTVLFRGVDGYDSTGQTVTPGVDLMGFVVGRDSSKNPLIQVINGAKNNATDKYCTVPSIPAHTSILLMDNAMSETQKEVAPDFVVPTPERVYLQKSGWNQLVSDYFDAQKKRIPFQKAQIAEATIKEWRRKHNRTLWFGKEAVINIDRGTMGIQKTYFTKGIRWQFKRTFEHAKGTAWTFAEIISLAKMKFTGQNCSSKAWWLMGKDMLEAIQNIDFTKHKDITMTSDTQWGFSCTKLHTVFGDFYLKHEPTLDYCEMADQGGIIDFEGLVRYWMKNEEKSSERIDGEEAKRDYMLSIEALALKGTSHIWVDGGYVGISLDKSTVSLVKGGNTTVVTATPVPSTATVTWTSSDTSKFTVSNGTVTSGTNASTGGVLTASISVDGETASATCAVTVTAS